MRAKTHLDRNLWGKDQVEGHWGHTVHWLGQKSMWIVAILLLDGTNHCEKKKSEESVPFLHSSASPMIDQLYFIEVCVFRTHQLKYHCEPWWSWWCMVTDTTLWGHNINRTSFAYFHLLTVQAYRDWFRWDLIQLESRPQFCLINLQLSWHLY